MIDIVFTWEFNFAIFKNSNHKKKYVEMSNNTLDYVKSREILQIVVIQMT